MLSARWARLEVPGDHQDVRVAGQESGQAHLGRRSVQGRGRRQHGGVLGHLGYTEERRAEGEVRHPGQVVLPAQVEEELARAVEEAVGVLAMRM